MKSFLYNHSFLLFLLAGAFLLRVFFAIILLQPGFGVHDDLIRYQDWGRVAYQYGVSDTYLKNHIGFGFGPNNQPPGTVYLDLATYSLSQITVSFVHQDFSIVYPFLLKLINILADIGIGALIYYLIAKNTGKKYALIGTSIFLLNPVVIYNSALWGQTDAITNFFFYGALTFLFVRKYFLSLLFFFFSLFIKISLLPLFPFFIVILLQRMKFQWRRAIMYLGSGIGILFVMTFPVSSNPLAWWVHFFLKDSSGELPYITNYAFNFWSVVFNPDSFSLVPTRYSIYWGLSLETWAYLIFGFLSIPLFVKLLRQKQLNDEESIGILSLVAFIVFLFLPGMHQRYFYPVLPLLATYIGIKHKGYEVYLLATLINFINLYVVWHPVAFLPAWFTTIIAHSKARLGMSILIVGAFVVLYIQILLKYQITKLFSQKQK